MCNLWAIGKYSTMFLKNCPNVFYITQRNKLALQFTSLASFWDDHFSQSPATVVSKPKRAEVLHGWQSKSLLLQCFFFFVVFSCSMRLQHPRPSVGSLHWDPCVVSMFVEANSIQSHHSVAEQSTAEEIKDAWVVVAIVHLIRTEVSIQ